MHATFFDISSHKKSLKQLHVIVCFSSAFTIYQHILLTNVYLEEIFRKELGFFNTCMLQIVALIYISYMCIYVILIFVVFILKDDERGE
jgi:hypothetical protein